VAQAVVDEIVENAFVDVEVDGVQVGGSVVSGSGQIS
jgi:hypothetical protein